MKEDRFMTVAIYGRSIEPEFFPYLKRLVEGLERKGVGMVCEEKFAALLSGNYGYEPKFLNCFAWSIETCSGADCSQEGV